MSKSGDKDSQDPAAKADLNEPPADDKRSGRITYDERGNSVWEWQLETGVYSRDISTSRLKKLEFNDLSIAETATHQRPPGLGDAPAKKPLPGGGFNPYDNTSTGRGNVGGNPYNSGASATHKAEPTPPAGPRKPMDLKQLEQWLEIRKRLQENKRDDDDD